MDENTPQYLRSSELLSRHDSRLLIVDVQEKLFPLIAKRRRMEAGCRRLIQGAGILNVPVYATEQYPQGLGRTIPELAKPLREVLTGEIQQKTRFSSAEVLGWGQPGGEDESREKVVVAGIEAHVCVLQTALDLIAQGFRVSIAADAVGSRDKYDRFMALQRMADSGAVLTTTEAVLFEWCEDAAAEEFKQISQLVKAQ